MLAMMVVAFGVGRAAAEPVDDLYSEWHQQSSAAGTPLELTEFFRHLARIGYPEFYVATRFWGERKALQVAWCESRFDPYATGSALERGIFQIHPAHARRFDSWFDAYDPVKNVDVAFQLWSEQ